jgi:hypothetical protein
MVVLTKRIGIVAIAHPLKLPTRAPRHQQHGFFEAMASLLEFPSL